MNSLENISFDKLAKIYQKYFTLSYLDTNMSDKFACISLTCCITKELKKKTPNITCYDVLLKICPDFREVDKNTFLKSLGAICESFLQYEKELLDFGIPVKEMPKQLKKLLGNFCPF